jgi:hypothetical protein
MVYFFIPFLFVRLCLLILSKVFKYNQEPDSNIRYKKQVNKNKLNEGRRASKG